MQFRFIAAAVVAIAPVACTIIDPVPPVTADYLRQAPLGVIADGKSLVLSASLWRDFQPVSPPDGQPLAAVVRVSTLDGSAVPSAIRADSVWVVYGNQVWGAAAEPGPALTPPAAWYAVVVRNGPKWGPGVTVDVVARLSDSQGATFLLRAADQPIGRTD